MWERALLANCLKTLLSLLILPGSGRPPSRSAAGPHRSWIPAAHHRWASFCCAPSCAWSTLASPPRIAKSLGLFAHSVRVFYAAEREGGLPLPAVVPAKGGVGSGGSRAGLAPTGRGGSYWQGSFAGKPAPTVRDFAATSESCSLSCPGWGPKRHWRRGCRPAPDTRAGAAGVLRGGGSSGHGARRPSAAGARGAALH